MLADAFAAERLRLSRARGTLFWAFLFAPIVATAITIGAAMIQAASLRAAAARGQIPAELAAELMGRPTYALDKALESVSSSNLFIIQIFFLIAASSIFAGDYRWESWRQLTPRNSRINLMAAKLAMFGLAAAGGLAVLALAGALSALAAGLIGGGGVRWARPETPALAMLGGVFAVAWLEMMLVGALAALTAVVTRSGLATVVAPVGVWIAQAFAVGVVMRGLPDPLNPPLKWVIALPALAGDVLKAALTPAPDAAPTLTWLYALAALVGWIALLAAATLAVFDRQDLPRE